MQYLTSLRPRGVLHPFDVPKPCSDGLRKAADLLRARLDFLDEQRFMTRFEGIGALFLSTIIQHSARPVMRRPTIELLYEDILEMMTAALCCKN